MKDCTYRPYRKDNNPILYINAKSIHPQIIKKQLPNMISNRISRLSCSKREFDSESHMYNSALQAGYTDEIKFEKLPQQQSTKKRSRNRKVIWFNPPYSNSVKTDIGAKFLSLINKHFGNSELKPFFNLATVKLQSYSCMPNMDSIISNHNRNILNTQYDISNNSRNQPFIPNSILSLHPTNLYQQRQPKFYLNTLNKIMQCLKRNVTAEANIVVL